MKETVRRVASPRRSLVLATLAATLAACSAPPRFEVDPVATPAESVVPLVLARNRALLDAQIGAEHVTLLLDLGADQAIGLSPASATRVGARFTGGTKSVSDAFGRSTDCRRYVLPDCTLGSLALHDVEGWEQPGDLDDEEHRVEGVVGWRLLERFGVLLDFPSRKLTLVSGGAAPAGRDVAGWTALPVAPTDDGMSASVSIEGRPRELLLDTGANWSVLKKGRVADDRLTEHGGVGFFHASGIAAGEHQLGPLDFAVLDLQYPRGDGILGFNFFAARAVWIDWPANRATIDAAPAAAGA